RRIRTDRLFQAPAESADRSPGAAPEHVRRLSSVTIAKPGVAVHRLNPRHRDDIARHLLMLPAEDRRLRFGQHIRDEAVREYVDRIDFDSDRVFGVHSADLTLVGVAHLALDAPQQVAE